MINNIRFIEYNNTLIEKNLINTYNINNTSTILLDYISNTNIYLNNKSLLKLNTCNYIGTNVRHYFGFSDIILSNITKDNVNDLLCNILIKNNENYIWSELVIKYYNIYFNSYNNKQINILNKLLEEIKELVLKIQTDVLLLYKKKYDLDVVSKSIYEYMGDNLVNIITLLFEKIEIFYILSICFSNLNVDYILIYNKDFLDNIKKYLV
tara:strand:- start:1042 stop:1668 length:627 start_codon:yes stop_codon:yes gene_type:complete